MNKRIQIICLLLLLTAILVSCAKTGVQKAPDEVSKPTESSESTPDKQADDKDTSVSEKPSELSEDEVIGLYNKANEVYGWFNLNTIPHDGEKFVEVDGARYFEVTEPGIDSKTTLVDTLNGIFAEDLTEELMTAADNRYVERDGKLYVMPADRGTDILKGKETYEITRVNERQIKLTVVVEMYEDPDQKKVIGYDRYDFVLEFSENRWRFKNFQLVR